MALNAGKPGELCADIDWESDVLGKLGNITALANFGKKTSTLLGVDISSTSVKILQISAAGDSYRFDNYVIRALPANSVVEKNISDIDAVGECIGAAVSILKPSYKDAAVACIPSKHMGPISLNS